jgi:hypothetical protein
MEPEGSLPCSQEPSLVPILSQIDPVHPIPLNPILILSTHLSLGLHSGLFLSGFPTNILYAFPGFTCHNILTWRLKDEIAEPKKWPLLGVFRAFRPKAM